MLDGTLETKLFDGIRYVSFYPMVPQRLCAIDHVLDIVFVNMIGSYNAGIVP